MSEGVDRVAFVIGSLGAGGSERQLIEILAGLDRARFRPFLYTVYPEGELREEVPSDVSITSYWEHHRFPRLNFPGRILRHQMRDLSTLLREQRIDLVCDRNFDMTVLAGWACRMRPTPRVSVVDCDPRLDIQSNLGRYQWVKRALLRRAYRASNCVVAVSDGVREGIRQIWNLQPDRIETIDNFINLERVERLASKFRPPMQEDRFHVVSVGRLHPQKGYVHMIAAMADVVHRRGRDSILWWVLGQGDLEEELRGRVAEAQLDKHVRFEGFQQNPYPYMRDAHLFCLPSLYEGMPNALGEAMACRVPILASDCPSGPREMLDNGRCGSLIPPADPRSLADALEDAMSNYPQWKERTGTARTHLEERYSSHAGVRKYEAVFTKVLEK